MLFHRLCHSGIKFDKQRWMNNLHGNDQNQRYSSKPNTGYYQLPIQKICLKIRARWSLIIIATAESCVGSQSFYPIKTSIKFLHVYNGAFQVKPWPTTRYMVKSSWVDWFRRIITYMDARRLCRAIWLPRLLSRSELLSDWLWQALPSALRQVELKPGSRLKKCVAAAC